MVSAPSHAFEVSGKSGLHRVKKACIAQGAAIPKRQEEKDRIRLLRGHSHRSHLWESTRGRRSPYAYMLLLLEIRAGKRGGTYWGGRRCGFLSGVFC